MTVEEWHDISENQALKYCTQNVQMHYAKKAWFSEMSFRPPRSCPLPEWIDLIGLEHIFVISMNKKFVLKSSCQKGFKVLLILITKICSKPMKAAHSGRGHDFGGVE
jgi:hypothetical protein